MKLQDCLRDYHETHNYGAPEIATLLGITNEQFKTFKEKGITGNMMLFFEIAVFLADAGYIVDDYSDLSVVNRTTIDVLLYKKATIEDYLRETGFSRDSFVRNLRGSRPFSEKNQLRIEALNARFLSETKEPKELKPGLLKQKKETDYELIFNLILAVSANATSLEKVLDNYLAVSTEDERKILRDNLARTNFTLFASSNAIHRLSQKLNALCSEKALENYRLNQKKEGK